MAVLLIGQKEKAEIDSAKARARRHPTPLDAVRAGALPGATTVRLADRRPGWHRPYPSQQVLIPFGYRAAISVEEQPAGLCWHLSISVERADPKWMPSEHSVMMIAEAFGIDFGAALENGMVWREEYEPGRYAINVVSVFAARMEGHA